MKNFEDELQQEVRTILDDVAGQLCAWLEVKLAQSVGDGWFEGCVKGKLLHGQDPQKFASGQWSNLSDLDLLPLIKVAQFNMDALNLDRSNRRLAQEMRDVRGRHHGHKPAKGLHLDIILDDLDTIAEFVKLLPTSTELYNRVNRSKTSAQNEWLRQNGGTLSSPENDQKDEAPRNIFQFGGRLRNQYETLTQSQENAVEGLQGFLEDRAAPCFMLSGYAGTGKTHLIGGLVKYLRRNARNAVLLAPTGRAARVLSERHRLGASTIHKSIYFLDQLIEYKSEEDPTTYKFYFDLQVNEHDHGTIFIVDEASMVSDMYSEQEFIRFGSGRLLKDLLEYVGFDGNDALKKIIFVGDNAQLPPVGMKFSPALSKKYLSAQYRLSTTVSELTDVLRQDENSAILRNATVLRDMLLTGKYPGFDFEVDNSTTFELNPHEAVNKYLDSDSAGIDPTQIIVTHSNAQAADFNSAIRKRLFPETSEIVGGDRIIIVRNNYNYEIDLMNGQIGRVSCANTETVSRNIPLGYDEKGNTDTSMKYVTLTFRKATVAFTDLRGEPHDLDCILLENLLYNKERALSSDEAKALYIDFRMRHKGLYPKQSLFKEYIKADPYFNALQIKFAYALTCHKAQGGEWPEVIVDFQGRKQLNADSLRWSYTAITRAREKLHAITPLHKDILTPVKPIESVVESTSDEKGGDANMLQKLVLSSLAELFKDEYEISCIHDTPYHLQFSLSNDSSISKINVHYNGKKVISRAGCYSGPEDLTQSINEKIESLKGLNIESLEKGGKCTAVYDLAFFKGEESLFVFHQALCEKVKENQVEIKSVNCYSAYHLGYEFSSAAHGDHFLNYYFNDNGTFQKVIPRDMEKSRVVLDLLHGNNTETVSEKDQAPGVEDDRAPF
ncbi:MAG: AAA family ATPase [FCB group bacterium]|nr:AAA family ATPase [FCB group bacterium]